MRILRAIMNTERPNGAVTSISVAKVSIVAAQAALTRTQAIQSIRVGDIRCHM